MCFSATANFVGSGVLAGVGVITLTRVKHHLQGIDRSEYLSEQVALWLLVIDRDSW